MVLLFRLWLIVAFFLLLHCSATLIVKWLREASQNYGLWTVDRGLKKKTTNS